MGYQPFKLSAMGSSHFPETAERLDDLLAIDVRVVCNVPISTAALLGHRVLIQPLESGLIQRRHGHTPAIC